MGRLTTYLDIKSHKILRSGFDFTSNLTSAIGDLANCGFLASYVSHHKAMAYDIVSLLPTRTVKEIEGDGGMDDQEVVPPHPRPAPARAVLATPKSISLPLGWSWIRGDRADSQQVHFPSPSYATGKWKYVSRPSSGDPPPFQHQL